MKGRNIMNFPSGKIDVLTLLYLEKQDLSNLTPEELYDKFSEVKSAISKRSNENNSQKND